MCSVSRRCKVIGPRPWMTLCTSYVHDDIQVLDEGFAVEYSVLRPRVDEWIWRSGDIAYYIWSVLLSIKFVFCKPYCSINRCGNFGTLSLLRSISNVDGKFSFQANKSSVTLKHSLWRSCLEISEHPYLERVKNRPELSVMGFHTEYDQQAIWFPIGRQIACLSIRSDFSIH